MEFSPVLLVPNWAMVSLLLLFLGLGTLAGIVYRRRLTSGTPPEANWRLVNELGWLSAPAVVILTFATMSTFHPSATGREGTGSRAVTVPVASPTPGNTRSATTRSAEHRTTLTSAKPLSQRPKWVDQQPASDGVSERFVLASQQYTTQEEAEHQLYAEASELLLNDLQKLRPGIERPKNWVPTEDSIRRIMVKQRYVEAVDRDFGNFSHPMYRVWWQTELSPEVRTEFLPEWRQAISHSRIQRVGIVASTLVLAASLVAIYRRLNVLTRGTRRPLLLFGSLAALTAWGFAIRFASERWF